MSIENPVDQAEFFVNTLFVCQAADDIEHAKNVVLRGRKANRDEVLRAAKYGNWGIEDLDKNNPNRFQVENTNGRLKLIYEEGE